MSAEQLPVRPGDELTPLGVMLRERIAIAAEPDHLFMLATFFSGRGAVRGVWG